VETSKGLILWSGEHVRFSVTLGMDRSKKKFPEEGRVEVKRLSRRSYRGLRGREKDDRKS